MLQPCVLNPNANTHTYNKHTHTRRRSKTHLLADAPRIRRTAAAVTMYSRARACTQARTQAMTTEDSRNASNCWLACANTHAHTCTHTHTFAHTCTQSAHRDSLVARLLRQAIEDGAVTLLDVAERHFLLAWTARHSTRHVRRKHGARHWCCGVFRLCCCR